MADYELSPSAEILARQFIQRWDIFPKQLDNGRWVTVHEPLHVGRLFDHLRGNLTLGTYLLDTNGRGRFLVLDADDDMTWNQLQTIANTVHQEGVPSYLEASRRGGHMWLFLSKRYDGRTIRQFGRGLLQTYGMDVKAVEIYPKQDGLQEGPGSLIRLPFGIHRRSRQRYLFQYPSGEPLGSTWREQLNVLGHVEKVEKRVFEKFRQHDKESQGKTRKGLSSQSQEHMGGATDLAKMAEQIKASISVKDFVAQHVELSASGQGLCPFHDDQNPSFSVNEDENYWYCFACKKGGSIIDFWMQWQGCNLREAISELAPQ